MAIYPLALGRYGCEANLDHGFFATQARPTDDFGTAAYIERTHVVVGKRFTTDIIGAGGARIRRDIVTADAEECAYECFLDYQSKSAAGDGGDMCDDPSLLLINGAIVNIAHLHTHVSPERQ